MPYQLTSAPKAIAIAAAAVAMNNAAAATTPVVAGHAQVAPFGSIQLSSEHIVGSAAWRAKQAARAAGRRIGAQRLTIGVSGLVTTPELALEELEERGTGAYRF